MIKGLRKYEDKYSSIGIIFLVKDIIKRKLYRRGHDYLILYIYIINQKNIP